MHGHRAGTHTEDYLILSTATGLEPTGVKKRTCTATGLEPTQKIILSYLQPQGWNPQELKSGHARPQGWNPQEFVTIR
jgi:hypothetical protein